MPDPTETIEEQIEEVVESVAGDDDKGTPQEEEKEESVVNSSGEEEDDKAKIIAGIMDNLAKGKPATDEPDAEEEAGDDISDKFTTAALAHSWTEEDIKSFAEKYTNEQLDEMIPFLAEEPTPPEKEAPAEESKKDTSAKADIANESEELKTIRAELADLKKSLGAVKEDKAAQERVNLRTRVDEIFDRAGEKFKVFGLTEELPRFPAGPRKGQFIPTTPEYKARSDVYSMAAKLVQTGVDITEAMEDALNWYKGKNLESDVKRNLIKGLKRQTTRLSAKRMGAKAVKTFTSEEERQADVVREAARKKGIDLD